MHTSLISKTVCIVSAQGTSYNVQGYRPCITQSHIHMHIILLYPQFQIRYWPNCNDVISWLQSANVRLIIIIIATRLAVSPSTKVG